MRRITLKPVYGVQVIKRKDGSISLWVKRVNTEKRFHPWDCYIGTEQDWEWANRLETQKAFVQVQNEA